jgi:hypothetical protein
LTSDGYSNSETRYNAWRRFLIANKQTIY